MTIPATMMRRAAPSTAMAISPALYFGPDFFARFVSVVGWRVRLADFFFPMPSL